MREWDVALLPNWPPLPSALESSRESRVSFSSLLPTSCSLRVLPCWLKPLKRNISEQPELVFLFFSADLNHSKHWSILCPWVQMLSRALRLYDSKKNNTSLVWRPEMSRHDSSSESFIIPFIIYGEGLCAGCCFPSVVRTAAGMLRWGEFIY